MTITNEIIRVVPSDNVVVKISEVKEVVKYKALPVLAQLNSTENVSFDELFYMTQLGAYSHQFYVLNPSLQNQQSGNTETNQKWFDYYRKIERIICEIKEKGSW